MGTLSDWIWVLGLAASWYLVQAWLAPQPKDLPPRERWPFSIRCWDHLNGFVAGIGFGMGIVFEWRMFRDGLLVILLLVVVTWFLSSRAWRRVVRAAAGPVSLK